MRAVAAQDQLEVQLEAALYPTSVPVVRATGALEGLLPNMCGEADQHSTRQTAADPAGVSLRSLLKKGFTTQLQGE